MGLRGWTCWMMVLLAVGGCGPRKRAAPAGAPVAAGSNLVAVLPFRVGGALAPDASFATESDLPPIPGDIGSRIAVELSAALARNGIATVDPGRVAADTPAPSAGRYDASLAVRVGREAGARFAVVGALTRFTEREGGPWGATTPATVWYQAMLVDVASGAVVDRQRFQYTQQPLSQNVLQLPRFLQGGGRWITRQEMLDGALGDTAANLASAVRAQPPPS